MQIKEHESIMPNDDMKYGDKYNWKNQQERLIYIGAEISNGMWYQFAKIDNPNVVWCEVRDYDLHMLEKTLQGDCNETT